MPGNKNSGRKSDAEIVRHYINMNLANNIANKELKRIDEKIKPSLEEIKTVVMPIALKGITDKSQVEHSLQLPIYNGKSNVQRHNSNSADIQPNEED